MPLGRQIAVDFVKIVYDGCLEPFLDETRGLVLIEDRALMHRSKVPKYWRTTAWNWQGGVAYQLSQSKSHPKSLEGSQKCHLEQSEAKKPWRYMDLHRGKMESYSREEDGIPGHLHAQENSSCSCSKERPHLLVKLLFFPSCLYNFLLIWLHKIDIQRHSSIKFRTHTLGVGGEMVVGIPFLSSKVLKG